MSAVVKLNSYRYEEVRNTEVCAGCKESLEDTFVEVKLDHGSHIEYLGFCEDCYRLSIQHGVQFQ
ncbi:hypothetical protein EQV77_17990 [Halobacillus fulvus]|nr:hypothetical protein EQV77_17990 [Halobacillus fulvus]